MIIYEIILGHGVVVFNKFVFVFVFFNVIHHVTSMWSVWWHGMILVVRGLNNTSEATLPILNTAPNTNTQPNTNIQTNTDFTWIALVDFLLPRWLRTTSIALIKPHSITSTNTSSNQIDKKSKFCGNWTNPSAKGKTKLIHFDLPSIFRVTVKAIILVIEMAYIPSCGVLHRVLHRIRGCYRPANGMYHIVLLFAISSWSRCHTSVTI